VDLQLLAQVRHIARCAASRREVIGGRPEQFLRIGNRVAQQSEIPRQPTLLGLKRFDRLQRGLLID
jgi:hypothetical protein